MTELISSEQVRVCNAGKKVMQIMTLHCESIYTANMTESMFLGDFYKLLFERFMNLSLRRFLYFLKEHSELCDWKKDEKIPKRNINLEKVQHVLDKIIQNGEFIDVPSKVKANKADRKPIMGRY